MTYKGWYRVTLERHSIWPIDDLLKNKTSVNYTYRERGNRLVNELEYKDETLRNNHKRINEHKIY